MTTTHDQMLALVNERVPDYTSEQKESLVTAAFAILAEPKYVSLADYPMTAVKIAIARLNRG
jgi:spore maturation protein CgeB